MAKRVSSIYGNALFELAVEENKMDALLSEVQTCLLYTSPSPRDLSTSRMPSSA